MIFSQVFISYINKIDVVARFDLITLMFLLKRQIKHINCTKQRILLDG